MGPHPLPFDHPAAPSLALGLGRGLFHWDRGPLPASLYIQPKRQYPIRQASCTPLGILPLVNWSNSPKKLVLSAHNSMMFGHSRAKRIPPMGRKFTLPHSLSEKVEEAVEPEDPRKKMEDLVETKRQNGGNRVPHNVGDIPFKCPLETGRLLSSLQCSPAPLDLHPNPPEDGLRENTQKSLMNCCPEGCVVTSSHGPAGNVVPDTDPPSCDTESPVPMCVDSPPPILPTPLPNPSTHSPVSIVQPISSKTVASTIAANASTSTSKLTSGPGVVNMDTTLLSKAVIFRSPQESGMGSPSFPQGHCSLKQRCPAKSPVFTSPPRDQKTALLASVAVSTSLLLWILESPPLQ
uniref:Uncharacterized protein n=1 Tax=Felis catus TaxID=9685 RepID=A0ABI7YN45_FELCA